MFQFDDSFLQAVGLVALPDDQKVAFLQHIREELELRVGTQLSEGLNQEQLTEFESFMNGQAQVISSWLQTYVPGWEQSEEFAKFKQTLPPGTPELTVQAEFASLKWLEANRPNYKEVVAAEYEKLKQEVTASRDTILGLDVAA